MFNPRNGMIAVTLIGAGLALNVMMSKKKEKKKVIEEVTLPIVQKKKLEPKPPQETTFERYLKTKETSGEKQMCDYCDKMNMSPSNTPVKFWLQNPKIHVIHVVKCCPRKMVL